MALERDFYRALEDALGPENVSQAPVVIESYAFPFRSGVSPETYAVVPRFEAITLPADTGQVQALVKLCNHYKIQFKASSTGWGAMNDPGKSGVIKF